MTEKYPDICHLVLTLLSRAVPSGTSDFPETASTPSPKVIDLLKTQKISSFIMDAEVVAVDKDTGAYRTFQDLSNRAKKDVRVEDIKVVVGVYAFDLMLMNDEVSLHHHGADLDPPRLAIFASAASAAHAIPTLCSIRSHPCSLLSCRVSGLHQLHGRPSGNASLLRECRRAEM